MDVARLKKVISEFIKSKYKNLPFAHTSLLSHHLAKLVEKQEILCDHSNYCYTLPGEKMKTSASIYAVKKSAVITNDQQAANEIMTLQNEEESVIRSLKSRDHMVDLLEERRLTDSEISPTREACGGINAVGVRYAEENGVKTHLKDSTVEILRKEGVVEEPEVALETSDGLCDVVVLDEQIDVLMVESGKEEENTLGTISKQRKAKLHRTSNTMKDEAYKTLWECQNEACSNIIALEKTLKQCREKDQDNKAGSESDDVSRLPLSMESCKELRRFAEKIESQLAEIIDSFDETVVPHCESRSSPKV